MVKDFRLRRALGMLTFTAEQIRDSEWRTKVRTSRSKTGRTCDSHFPPNAEGGKVFRERDGEREDRSSCWARTRSAATASGGNGRRARLLLCEANETSERGKGTVMRPRGDNEVESGEHGEEGKVGEAAAAAATTAKAL